jgi:hypothetical protein
LVVLDVERERRYPSDLTDEQWAFVEAMLPLPKGLGRPESHPRRAIVDAILYVVRTGCSWRQLPVDFPPWQTVYGYFIRWEARGVTERFIVTDTLGLLITVSVVAASVQDRDGAKFALLSAYLATPIRFVFPAFRSFESI